MGARKNLLLRSAARLYSRGLDLDASKERIRRLVADGISYDAQKMVQAVQE